MRRPRFLVRALAVLALAAGPLALSAPASAADCRALRDGDRVALQGANGQYLMARGGGGGDVGAYANAIGGWETFTLDSEFSPILATSNNETDIGLRARSGQYLMAYNGGGGGVDAVGPRLGSWEQFDITLLSADGGSRSGGTYGAVTLFQICSNDVIALRTSAPGQKYFLQPFYNGSNDLRAVRPESLGTGLWERFRIVRVP